MIVSNGSRTDDGDPYDRKLFRRNGVAFRDFSRGLKSPNVNDKRTPRLVRKRTTWRVKRRDKEKKLSYTDTLTLLERCDTNQHKSGEKLFNVSGALFLINPEIFKSYPDTLLGSENLHKMYRKDRDEYFIEHNKHIFQSVIRFYTHEEEIHYPPCIPKDVFEEALQYYGLFPYYKGIKSKFQNDAANHATPSGIKEKLFYGLRYPGYSKYAKFYAIFDLLIIILSTAILVLESVPELQDLHGLTKVEWVIEVFVNTYFTIQTVVLLAVYPSRVQYFRSWNNWVDIISILPFYVKVLAKSYLNAIGGFRVLRLIRLLRILKLFRHSQGSQNMMNFLFSSIPEIVLVLLMWSIGVLLFGPLIYFIEKDTPSTEGKNFTSAFTGMWFCVVTIGTVGYGDFYPRSDVGKGIAGLYTILNLTVMTIPISIIITKFSRSMKLNRR